MAGQGLNDLLFKRFTARSAALGVYFAGVGLVWGAALLLVEGPGVLAPGAATLAYGLVSGTFSVAANVALVRALTHLDAAIGVTIFRLNFVLVVCLAVPLLREPLTAPKLSGLGAAVLAVLLFARDHRKGSRPAPARSLALAVLASLLRAGMGLTYKLAFVHGVAQSGFLFVNALCWLVGGALWAALAERDRRVDRHRGIYALASGLLVVEIVVTLARALQVGQASIVVPITQLSFLLTALVAAALLREPLRRHRLLALACGIGAVLALLRA